MRKNLLVFGFSLSLLGSPVTPSYLSTATLCAEPPVGSQRTALDDYVAKPDTTYEWKVEGTVENAGFKTAIIKLKSQTWRTEKDVDRPVWEHWLVVTVPPKVTSDRAFLMIGGGSHNSKQPTGPDAITGQIRSPQAVLWPN